MQEIQVDPDEANMLGQNGIVILRADYPADLYRTGEKVIFADGHSCIDIGSACRICGGKCCNQNVILSPLEVVEIADYLGAPASKFCGLKPAPDYAENMRSFFANYFRVDKGLLCTKLKDSGDCVFETETGCALPAKVKPATCRLFPLNFEYDGPDLWEPGTGPSAVDFYMADYSDYETACFLVTSFEKVDLDQVEMKTLFDAMGVDFRAMQLACWKFAKSIPFWNDAVYPRIDGQEVDDILELIRAVYDERAIFGRLLADIEAGWFGE
ncbi:MAG TPA: hypothetical protein VKK79_00380 [Candidatus Lokiarchaeia archaeon]|nr:hypothetical protein [Candidatus Lokiarchaeia archaeon]